jgi:hypothetical protein
MSVAASAEFLTVAQQAFQQKGRRQCRHHLKAAGKPDRK